MITPIHKKGFTLLELLVVIALIGILSSIVLASLNRARDKSADTARMATMREIEKALNLYYSNNGSYPVIGVASAIQSRPRSWFTLIPQALAQPIDGTDGITTTIENVLYPQYLTALPEGNGGAYYYESDGQLYCLGALLRVTQTPSNTNFYCLGEGDHIGLSMSVLGVDDFDEYQRMYAVGNVTQSLGC